MLRSAIVASTTVALVLTAAVPSAAGEDGPSPPLQLAPVPALAFQGGASRPAALPTLYVTYAALQVYDVYSTRRALELGAREANPIMQPAVDKHCAFWAMKASATVGTILAAEHLWRKKNKKTAIAVLVASNAVAAAVAARNASVLRSHRR